MISNTEFVCLFVMNSNEFFINMDFRKHIKINLVKYCNIFSYSGVGIFVRLILNTLKRQKGEKKLLSLLHVRLQVCQ